MDDVVRGSGEVTPRVDSAARLVRADAATVFAAMVDPGALVRWLPPRGMTGRFEHVDIRTGGSYRLVLTYRGGVDASRAKTTADSDVAEARIVEVRPDERIVQEVDFDSEDERFRGTMTMTWALRPARGGTRVEIRAESVPVGISAEEHAAGMTDSLENLARLVESGS